MSRILILILLIAVALVIAAEHDEQRSGLPLVKAAAAPCAPLQNPCDIIDCKRTDTRTIT